MKSFPINFVRQFILQALFYEHVKNPGSFFGGPNQVELFSFYEQLDRDDEVNRYVEVYRDLTDQQNRTGLIMNGTIIAPENPTITNMHQCLIIPLSFTTSFRVKLADRDLAINTINNLLIKYKGRHYDISELGNGKLIMVGTLGNNTNGSPTIKSGDYLGQIINVGNTIDYFVSSKLTALTTSGFVYESGIAHDNDYYYVSNVATSLNPERLMVVKKVNGAWVEITDDGTYPDIVFPNYNGTFTKYKLSLSFDSIRCDEPRILNANEYCLISFGGSATLCDKDILLGNDLTKLSIQKFKIVAENDIGIPDNTIYWLEPLELPSGNSANTLPNILRSNNFISNSHTDNITISNQYTFMMNRNIKLLRELFEYARYGIQSASNLMPPYVNGITPNMIYKIKEMWIYWGEVYTYEFNAKIVESIDIENTESDTLTITIPFQIQGENN